MCDSALTKLTLVWCSGTGFTTILDTNVSFIQAFIVIYIFHINMWPKITHVHSICPATYNTIQCRIVIGRFCWYCISVYVLSYTDGCISLRLNSHWQRLISCVWFWHYSTGNALKQLIWCQMACCMLQRIPSACKSSHPKGPCVLNVYVCIFFPVAGKGRASFLNTYDRSTL